MTMQNQDARDCVLDKYLKQIPLDRSDLSYADLSRMRLPGIKMRSSVLNHANIQHTDLTEARLGNTSLDCADLRGARLDRANLARASLRKAQLLECSLVGADLDEAVMLRAEASSADFTQASLLGVNLSAGNLRHAKFNKAHLCSANLTCADFSDADLSEADLTGASLEGTCFYRANLTGAKYGPATLNLGICSITGLEWPVFIFDRHIKIGCQMHLTRAWSKFEDEHIACMANGAVRFWHLHKDTILGLAKSHQKKGCWYCRTTRIRHTSSMSTSR